MKCKILIAGIVVITFVSCGNNTKSTDNKETKDSIKTETTQNDGKIDPFKDFPKDPIIANVGDYVLTPSENWQQDATDKGADKVTFIFYDQKIAATGNEYSKIDFMSKKGVEIPNYMIIPIKAGQTAKKGDIILTWWQSGSGMKRAIVTDASNPNEPIVNYIDIDWNNPAKNSAGIGIGQQSEKIKPNTFQVINNMWEAGTSVAAKDGSSYKLATIVKVSGDKVLTIGFAGKMKVYAKSDCSPIAIKPNVKAGDMVQVPWVGTFKNSKVQKVDAKNGRVFCDNPFSKEPLIIPFGNVTSGLDVK
ncbi:MAG: hypothetical protein AUJ97_00390 [Bacteroidetes bacterium CG2_30_32_10]|nr:MAG: hypothetical protein AUJ97_00390 [Bacteroidetes bacterium CG2_30_32_10]